MSALSEFKHSYSQAKKFRGCIIINAMFYFMLSFLIRNAQSRRIVNNRRIILFFCSDSALYLVARALFLNAEYEQAVKLYKRVIVNNPTHVESYYGLAEVYRLSGDFEKSREIITRVLTFSGRLKTWLLLANLVNTKNEFEELKLLWERERLHWDIPLFHYDVNDYLTIAALRAKEYEEAIQIVKKLSENVSSEVFVLPKPVIKKFSINDAKNALLDLKKVLDSNGITFFLVSGTLLGCIRDKKILKHDKDIDVGVWEDVALLTLFTVISHSGMFDISPMRSPYSLRVKHVNGVAIDIFFHYRNEDGYWHGGSKLKWCNSPFNLIEYKFCGEYFNIPDDYDLYLTENYGNWKQIQEKFDSAFDTNNSELINSYELKVHAYKKMIMCINKGDKTGVDYYKSKLSIIDYN